MRLSLNIPRQRRAAAQESGGEPACCVPAVLFLLLVLVLVLEIDAWKREGAGRGDGGPTTKARGTPPLPQRTVLAHEFERLLPAAWNGRVVLLCEFQEELVFLALVFPGENPPRLRGSGVRMEAGRGEDEGRGGKDATRARGSCRYSRACPRCAPSKRRRGERARRSCGRSPSSLALLSLVISSSFFSSPSMLVHSPCPSPPPPSLSFSFSLPDK